MLIDPEQFVVFETKRGRQAERLLQNFLVVLNDEITIIEQRIDNQQYIDGHHNETNGDGNFFPPGRRTIRKVDVHTSTSLFLLETTVIKEKTNVMI